MLHHTHTHTHTHTRIICYRVVAVATVPPPRSASAGRTRRATTWSASAVALGLGTPVRPISVLRFWISEGLTQAESQVLGPGIPRTLDNFPEILSQRVFVGTILAGRLGVGREAEEGAPGGGTSGGGGGLGGLRAAPHGGLFKLPYYSLSNMIVGYILFCLLFVIFVVIVIVTIDIC